MKPIFFLAAGLLVTAFGFAQTSIPTATSTTHYATSPGSAGAGGNDSVHIGDDAGDSSANKWNVFVGRAAGYNNYAPLNDYDTKAYSNTFIGYIAGFENTTGNRNVYVGSNSGQNNVTGIFNAFVGSSAGSNATGGYNVFVGGGAGSDNVGNESTIIGSLAGRHSTGGSNILIGHHSGSGVSNETENNGNSTSLSGSNNVFLGNYTGKFITIGSNNIFIGNGVGSDPAKVPSDTSNKLYIDNSNTANPLIYGDFTTAKELKFNAKKVGIGYDTNSEFGDFPTLSFSNAGIYRFFVRGGILAEEVRIRSYANWADYVFTDDYNLMPLSEVEQYIAANGHLPNMPSAKEVEEEGLELGNIVKLQQEKIEELTLHLIAQEKRLEAKEKEIEELKDYKKELDELKAQVKQLLNKE